MMAQFMQYRSFFQAFLSEESLPVIINGFVAISNHPSIKDYSHSLNLVIIGQKITRLLASFELVKD